jgi:pyridoxal-phosphate dependent TrpB-like enzyme
MSRWRDRVVHEIPEAWFNLAPHLPAPIPPAKDPDDTSPSRIALMARIRLRSVLAQEASREPFIPIPGPVLERYEEFGRPTPLMRARNLEAYLGTPAKIFIKREDMLPTGSFKLNSSIAQAWFASAEGVPSLVTETGAGQWGHAVAFSARLYGLKSVVFWANVSARQKKDRGVLIRMLGGTIHASPSQETTTGQMLSEQGLTGSLGTAIGEAITFASMNPGYKYISGSNHLHVIQHQSIIGLETKRQLEALGEQPTKLIACVGGGSNLAGFIGPFLPEWKEHARGPQFIAAEAATAPRLTQGQLRYDHADPIGVSPLSMSYTLGRDYPLPETHIGGLRQHNGSPVVGVLRQHNVIQPRAYAEPEIFESGKLLLQQEGILAAPESCHAVRAAIDCANEAKQANRADVIVFCLSGNGLLDLGGYAAHEQMQADTPQAAQYAMAR